MESRDKDVSKRIDGSKSGSLGAAAASGKSALRSTAATSLAGASRTGQLGASAALGKSPTKATRVIEEVKDGESSGDTDYDEFDEEELSDGQQDEDTLKPKIMDTASFKAQLNAAKTAKEQVRAYEKDKAKGTTNALQDSLLDATDASATQAATASNISVNSEQLNQLWERMRYFLNGKDEEGNPVEGMVKPGRIRFTELCETKADRGGATGLLDFDKVTRSFISSRLQLEPKQFQAIFRALEVYHDTEERIVNWRSILSAPVERESQSVMGIFPRIRKKQPGLMELENAKRQKEEIRVAEARTKAEEDRLAEKREKELTALRKADAQPRRKVVTKPGGKPSAEEIKKREKDEKARNAEESQFQKKRQEVERKEVSKEVAVFNQKMLRVKEAFNKAGSTIFNEMKMADTNRDGNISLQEFMTTLQRMKVNISPDDILYVFGFIDENKDNKLSYRELELVLRGQRNIDPAAMISARRAQEGLDHGYTPSELAGIREGSKQVSFDKNSINTHTERSIGDVSGMSSILRKSDPGDRKAPPLNDPDEHSRNQKEIRDTFLANAQTFEDLIARMGKARPDRESQVSFFDFFGIVQQYIPGRFSGYQVKFVFKALAHNLADADPYTLEGAYMTMQDFKDKFYPGKRWQPEIDKASEMDRRYGDDNSSVTSKSAAISTVMQGKTQSELYDARDQAERKQLMRDRQRMLASGGGGDSLMDEFERGSAASEPLDNIMAIRRTDPKSMKPGQEVGVKQSAVSNDKFFRQAEVSEKVRAAISVKHYDSSMQHLVDHFCEKVTEEINEAATVQRKRLTAESFVDRYGVKSKGYVYFEEFQEIYKNHVHYADDDNFMRAMPDDAKLRGLFNTLDPDQRQRISRQDFGNQVRAKAPSSSFMGRLRQKLLKGKERLHNVIMEDLQDADRFFGAQGVLPLAVVQTLMNDYDLPMVDSDKKELKELKHMFHDSEGNLMVAYQKLLGDLAPPKKVMSAERLARLVTRVQAHIRGFLGRKLAAELGQQKLDSLRVDIKGLSKDKTAVKKEAPRPKLTKEQRTLENKKKKEKAQQQQRLSKRNAQDVDKRLDGVVRNQRDARDKARTERTRLDIQKFIKEQIIESLVEKAYCYGESLEVCKDIQKKFEMRPVTKFIYPLLQQFQFSCAGVQPKSLQTINSLGQLMFLNRQNQLSQYDISTARVLQNVNLGTRPPLKHYDIIDLVCDQRSGRIYTLNSNWILEIWNIEQNASFPQKRISVCSNEGGKDFINLYYRSTFNNSKPKFLSLQESNQQILVVNTSCVDGSVVFIDPISFSMLKKIQFRYADYEMSPEIRQSIRTLREVFTQIKQRLGKDLHDIFSETLDEETGEVRIKAFVERLWSFDQSVTKSDLYRTVHHLDADGSGSISIDEFLNYFTTDIDNTQDLATQDSMLQDEIWPKWVVKEKKLPEMETILSNIYKELQQKFGLSPEQAFGMFDYKDSGHCTVAEFKRVIATMFSEVITKQAEIDLLLRLSPSTANDGRTNYKELCKFLDKRFVRSFKYVQDKHEDSGDLDLQSHRNKSPVEIELERPLSKESSLNYILRKAAELQIDLRKEFVTADPLELSVLPRVKIWNLLINLALGLNEPELTEVFENDLNFDNYGNVDYTGILNSDIFVALEQKRLRERALDIGRRVRLTKLEDDTLDDLNEALGGDDSDKEVEIQKATDNRKVVVEDLIYIDDLQIVIYTTIAPKTSQIFITSLSKVNNNPAEVAEPSKPGVEIITLEDLSKKSKEQKATLAAKMEHQQKLADSNMVTNAYQLVARLRGHKNDDPPSICYIPQSNCLVSAEKDYEVDRLVNNEEPFPLDDPDLAPSHVTQNSQSGSYEKFSNLRKGNVQSSKKQQKKYEILIWNLQRDMIELFTQRPPWNVPVHKKFVAHDASIVDICYLQKAQLLVTSSMDQTIRFWDPIATSFQLTDPSNNPHAQMKPGYYKPMESESTKKNETFREVKRIYTGSETVSYALRTLNIGNIIMDPKNPQQKSQIEWLLCLKLAKPPVSVQQDLARAAQMGFVCGYGIERVKISVPALHHDDIEPPHIVKECEELVAQRRQKLVTAFQAMLPVTIDKIYNQVQLQNSYIDRVRQLFMSAILNRKDGIFVNPVPLREIYKIILKLPNRTKFESFLASTGCADKLSVSETFFYLQMFMQIHPLRTTQIEFEKSIEDFYEKHQRQFLRGVKKWPKKSLQKFANYIREHGLDVRFLMQPNEGTTESQAKILLKFCTRERILNFFLTRVSDQTVYDFSDEDIDVIMNELDPYSTGVIQVSLIQRFYAEEIKYHQQVNLNRPQEVLQQIRAMAFPAKRIPLQQSLAAADTSGDGYIDCNQFVDAFYTAKVNLTRDSLEFLFDVMGENFQDSSNTDDPNAPKTDTKYLNLIFFMGKLFSRHEAREVNEVDLTLQLIKASLIYKGVDLGNVFAEDNADNFKKPQGKKGAVKGAAKVKKIAVTEEKKVDMMSHYSRFAQCIVKDEFCVRLEQVNATNVTPDMIRRLANYLSLNQKNKSVIYLNTWLHHLKRVQTAFNEPRKEILPAICSKLLLNETFFRSIIDTIGLLKQKREDEKVIDMADLRTVLKKFGVNYININMFLNEFIPEGVPIHIERLVTRMKANTMKFYGRENQQQEGQDEQSTEFTSTAAVSSQAGVSSLESVQNVDYFTKVGKKLRKAAKDITLLTLVQKFAVFDQAETGYIKSYYLVNVLHQSMPGLFTEAEMVGLQFELESLSYDGTVDYQEFMRLFIGQEQSSRKVRDEKLKLDVKKSAYSMQDYEDLLARIQVHSKDQGLNLEHIFGIFAKKSGFITYPEFAKILELIGFEITDQEFNLITMYADENKQDTIFVYDLVQQIIHAEVVAPQFDISKWVIASGELQGRTNLLDFCQEHIDQLSHEIETRFGDEEQKHTSKVITCEQFQEIIRDTIPELSAMDIDLLTKFGVKGSRRQAQLAEKISRGINLDLDLIQFKHFEQALNQVIQHMTKEEIQRKQKEQELLLDGEIGRTMHKLKLAEDKKKKADLAARNERDPARVQREQQLISLVTNIFRTREISFHDAFKEVYDVLSDDNKISISMFKKYVNTLNLPLNVQDQRILRRIADPDGIGKVDLKIFSARFDCPELRQQRLNKVLDQVATAFYINNFDMKKAFALFDRNGDGVINSHEFRQGLNSLDIGLHYDEIDELNRAMSTQGDGTISYDDFIQQMDANIRHRRLGLQDDVTQALFLKLQHCLEYCNETLYDVLKRSDFNDSETILREDLVRAMKRIGMSNVEPHLPLILETGGASMSDERIDIINFSRKLTEEVMVRKNEKDQLKTKFLRKLHSLLTTKGLSLFDFFMRLDVNCSSTVNKTELKTGMQALGIHITREEFEAFWKALYKPQKKIHTSAARQTSVNKKQRPAVDSISYSDLIKAFVNAGCIRLEKSTDRQDTLMTKFRQQLKRLGYTPEKAYRAYDEDDHNFVFKSDFTDISLAMDLDFTQEELAKLFQIICKQGTEGTESNDQQVQVAQRKPQLTTGSRFDLMQFVAAVSDVKDENWLYQAYIKIHSTVLQKSVTYKRLFTQWREKGSKAGALRLSKPELIVGLKRLKAGLTQDEINRLAEVQPYEGRDSAIGYLEFQERVIQGAEALEQEQSYERMALVEWIQQFNAMMETNDYPFDKIFSQFDSGQIGGLIFQDFINMNEFVGVALAKKKLKKVFEIVDKDRSGRIDIGEVRKLSLLTMRPDEGDSNSHSLADELMEANQEDLKGNDILLRHQVNELYEEVKSKLEHKNVTLEHVFFASNKFDQDAKDKKGARSSSKSKDKKDSKEKEDQLLPTQLVTKEGVTSSFLRIGITLSKFQAERIVKDVRLANENKFEITYKDFIDFMTRKRINVAFLERGFIDPILAGTCTQIQSIRDAYEITFERIFNIFCRQKQVKDPSISKEDFVEAVQSMGIKTAVEDINELFNYIDEAFLNRIHKSQFVNAISYITSKVGAGSAESHMSKGIIQVKKKGTNIQLVLKIMGEIADGIQKQKLTIRQLSYALDINHTGYLTPAEFTHVLHNLVEELSLENIRLVTSFLDDRNTGRISTQEFLRICMEIINQKTGGGVFAYLQVQPVIQQIINQLFIDCDRFFDQVADRNQQFLIELEERNRVMRKEQRIKQGSQGIKGVDEAREEEPDGAQFVQNSLSKSVFFSMLMQYGVHLDENEKALISSVFSLKQQHHDMLDYQKLDSAFEGVQQQLYDQDKLFTPQWERRMFKRIGNYLMQNNMSIEECFNTIDTDNSQTISFVEFAQALNRFQLNLSEKQLKMFLQRLGVNELKSYLTKQEFLTRFWAAYTYENIVPTDEEKKTKAEIRDADSLKEIQKTELQIQSISHNVIQANRKIKSELDDKTRQLKMFRSIQKQIKSKMEVQRAFTAMDNRKIGFLSIRDFHISFARLFDLAIKNDETRALFNEIDTDQDGIIKFAEFEAFYAENYIKRLAEIEREREMKNTQNEIFDHLIKVLLQKGLTLQDCFDQIDDDKNGYIEVDEFHGMLERMGFTITEEQVYQIMVSLDDNFDGKLSYQELRAHIEKLGFNIEQLEERDDKWPVQHTDIEIITLNEHVWRDKALELVIRAVRAKLEKNESIFEYFKKYDDDHDVHLTPRQFRRACLDLNEPQLNSNQIDRILHILLEQKKAQPLIDIARVNKLLSTYSYLSLNDGKGSGNVLIGEDLFVYIVERFDGLSRMRELSENVYDRTGYLSRHIYELNMRGLHMLSNQQTVKKLCKKTYEMNRLYESTSILLAGEVTRLIKEEAQMCVLDPTFNIDTIVNDDNFGVLKSISLPTIEQAAFDIDYSTMNKLPCGACQYDGLMLHTKQSVEITVYPNEALQYTSLDGKSMKTHLGLELQVMRYLMGSRFEEEDEFTQEEEDAMDVFLNLGKFEKRIGLSMHDEKEIYVVNKTIDEDIWMSLDDFVNRNGGILNIPLFYHTDAPLFIIRHWAKIILKIIDKVHDVSIVLRCLNTKQLWISRDGQRIRLGHTRGVGFINNMGFVQQCPDIYIHLDNNEATASERSSTFAPSKGAFSSSRKTDSGRVFSNQSLDDPFVSPEILFNKFQDQTAAMDVWSFGIILFSVLFGKKPASYYKVYREWYLKSHQHDVEMSNLPFIPPSPKNFIYDPFSLDFDSPFDKVDYEELLKSRADSSPNVNNMYTQAENDSNRENGTFNFENFMKSIESLSYSAMFQEGNSKKFTFKPLSKQIQENGDPKLEGAQVPRFPGQQEKNSTYREKTYLALAKATVLDRKNELGLILDLISSCLDVDPKKRPTIQGMLNSPIFMLDNHELTNAVRFSRNVILYRSPQSTVSLKITEPLRKICSDAIADPMSLFDREQLILKLFSYTEDCITHIQTLPIEEINEVLTEKEKRKGLMANVLQNAAKNRDSSTLRVSPNSPVAAQIMEDKVIDMLLFITFRFMKHFKTYKEKRMQEIELMAATLASIENDKRSTRSQSGMSKSVRFGENSVLNSEAAQTQMSNVNKKEILKRQTERLQNHVLKRMCHLMKLMVYEMHSYCTPLSPFAGQVIRYIVKFFIGEENTFGSETVLKKTSGVDNGLGEYLKERTFFRRDKEYNEKFKSDPTDKAWHLEQKNKCFLDKSNYWNNELHKEALKIFKDAITESGMGQSCYPVINDYIQNVTNSFEPNKIFSKQMNLLSMSFLIPMNYTAAYYNELIPLTESLSRLYNPDLENAGKKCSLAMIRSVFQTGNSDKIKACLDLRLPKHVIHFLQDSMSEIRRECLLVFLEISKGLQDEDFTIQSRSAVNLPQEYSKQGYHKTAADQHKAISMASQQEVLDNRRRGTQAKQRSQQEPIEGQTEIDQMCNYMKRTIALIEKNENEKYINFALDIPNLNFQASKRFLTEMAVCFESPVFIAPLIRLLKTQTETFENKRTILDILKNLVCGNERVLIALNSPACDTYMTLLKMLMQNTKTTNARAQPNGLSAQMRSFLALQDKTIDLFRYMFDQRRPSIIRDISCIGASGTLLREAGLQIPKFISLADIIGFFDMFENSIMHIRPESIFIDDWVAVIMDLRCWVKHFYATSTIPELSRIKALQRCINLLIRIFKVVWAHYYSDQVEEQDGEYIIYEKPTMERKQEYMRLIRSTLMLFDWICLRGKFIFLFNEECGRANLKFIIDTCNKVLGQFRRPFENADRMGPLEDLTFHDRENKKVQKKRTFEMFEMTDIGAILQNILYQLVKKNDTFLNKLLSEANFGFIFGEQLILEFDFIRHCIDNQIESMVLMDSYVKKNEIRLNTFEYLLRSHEHTLKDQFIKSNFADRLFLDYIQDFREFNIQFSKIDIEFLAFRRSYPLRLESISMLNTVLMLKRNSPQVYTEILMYARRHFLIREEMNLLMTGSMTNREATSLLLFAIILESNEEDLIYVMVQEGVHRIIKGHLKEYPSLKKRFPILHQFISGATRSTI